VFHEVPLSTTSTVQVRYRHHEIAAAAPISALSGGGDGTHRLELDDPPPVRTVLAVVDDGRTRAFEVREVIEVPSEGAPRGCVLAEVAPERLPRAVGTEDRPAGLLGSAASEAELAPVADEVEADADGYGAHMAVPAPVVSDDASEPLQLGGESDSDDASDKDGDDNGDGDTPAAETTDDGDAATPDGAAGGRAKKRRGRQRR